jgi:hypothetical protein
MAYLELDTTLSRETKAMLKEVTHFARKVMRPAGVFADALKQRILAAMEQKND